MRRPRATIKGLMIAVAAVAMLLAAFEAGRRYESASGRVPPFRSRGGLGP